MNDVFDLRALYISSLMKRSDIYFLTGQVDKALSDNEEVIRSAKDTALRAKAQLKGAEMHRSLANYEEAMKILSSDTLKKAARNDGAHAFISAETDVITALILKAQGNIDEAEKKCRDAIEGIERAAPASDLFNREWILLKAYNNLGTIGLDRGKFDSALHNYSKSLDIAKKINDILSMGKIYGNMGNISLYLWRNADAVKNYEKALEIFSRTGDLIGMGLVYGNLGLIYKNEGKYRLAKTYYEKCLVINEKTKDRGGLARNSGNLGTVCERLGDRKKALYYYNISLKINLEMKDIMGIGKVYGNLGYFYSGTGDLTRSRLCFLKSVNYSERASDKLSMSIALNDLAMLSGRKMKFGPAFAYLKRSGKISREINDMKGLSFALSDMGTMFSRMGEYKKAAKCYLESLECSLKEGFKTGIHAGSLLLGIALMDDGDLERSHKYLEDAQTMHSGREMDNWGALCIIYNALLKLLRGKSEKDYYLALKEYSGSREYGRFLSSDTDKIEFLLASARFEREYFTKSPGKKEHFKNAKKYYMAAAKIFSGKEYQDYKADALSGLAALLTFAAAGNEGKKDARMKEQAARAMSAARKIYLKYGLKKKAAENNEN